MNQQQQQQQATEQPQAQPQAQIDQTTPAVPQPNSNPLNLQEMPPMDGNFMNPGAMPGMIPGQPFIPDPSMAGMPMPNAQLMMPIMMANGNASAPAQANGISADEIALYDRQIRLWGVAAQAKIQSANVLLITIKALASEIAKNLALAGIGSLTILDDATVTEADLGAQFFLAEVENPVGQNRANAAAPAIQKLNPRVQVHVDVEGVKNKGPSYFAAFDVVIATDLDTDSFNLINTATRINNRKFYAASTQGMYGFLFSDLIEHDYVIEREVGNIATQPRQETRTRSVIDVKSKQEGTKKLEIVTKRELYSTWFLASDMSILPEEYTKSKRRLKSVTPALSCLRALWEFLQLKGKQLPGNREDLKLFTQIATQKHKALGLPSETLSSEFLRSFLQNLGSEIAPVAAILGGQLAQDVINVLGQKEQPIQNMVIFDGTTMEALMYPLHPEGTLGTLQLSIATNDPMMPNGSAGGDMMMGGMGMGGMGFDPNVNPNVMAQMPPDVFSMGGMMPQIDPMTGIPAGTFPSGIGEQATNGSAQPLQAPPVADATTSSSSVNPSAPQTQPANPITSNEPSTNSGQGQQEGHVEPPQES